MAIEALRAEAWRPFGPAAPEGTGLWRSRVAIRPGDQDDELMARIAAGETGAFRRLMDRHIDAAYRLARRVIGSDAEAEDVVQEAFLKVWMRARFWKPGGARFSTWLWRVVLNQSLDQLRHPKPAPLDTAPEPADPAADPAEALIERQDETRVAQAVAELPERQRAAIALIYGAGASNAEAAEALGISVGALEQLLVRARRSLRARLKDSAT
jgi:RNA polymerase sigma-70 factor (ECF subfamily)